MKQTEKQTDMYSLISGYQLLSKGKSHYTPQTPGRLNNKEGCTGDEWIFLGRGNRTDFEGGMGAGRDGSREDQRGKDD